MPLYYGKILSLATFTGNPVWANFDGGIGYLKLPAGAPPDKGTNYAVLAATAWVNDRYVWISYTPDPNIGVDSMYVF